MTRADFFKLAIAGALSPLLSLLPEREKLPKWEYRFRYTMDDRPVTPHPSVGDVYYIHNRKCYMELREYNWTAQTFYAREVDGRFRPVLHGAKAEISVEALRDYGYASVVLFVAERSPKAFCGASR